MRWLLGALLIVAPLAGVLAVGHGNDAVPGVGSSKTRPCHRPTACDGPTEDPADRSPDTGVPDDRLLEIQASGDQVQTADRSSHQATFVWEVPTALAADPAEGQAGTVERSVGLEIPPGLWLRWHLDLSVEAATGDQGRAYQLRLVGPDGRTVCAVHDSLGVDPAAHQPARDGATCASGWMPPSATWETWDLVLEHRWDRPGDGTVQVEVTLEVPGPGGPSR